MNKKEFLSKFKNYDNELEKILEKKNYSEDAKSLLLSMFYKIEAAYKDYSIMKNEKNNQKDYICELLSIIDKQCEEIQLVKPKSEESNQLEEKNIIAYVEENKIICYPTEKALLYALGCIVIKKFTIEENMVVKKALEKMLVQGANIEQKEILRDFNGWSWNVQADEVENINCNLMYQNMRLLIGKDKLDSWKKTEQTNWEIIKKILKKKYGEELTKELCKNLYLLSILDLVKQEFKEKNRIEEQLGLLNNEFDKMKNNVEYLKEIANSKKNIENRIKNIDSILNNVEKLKEELIQRNQEKKDEDKILNISMLVEIMQVERRKELQQIKKCNEMMEPKKFIEKKEQLIERISLFKEIIGEDISVEEKEKIYKINLQKTMIKIFEKKMDEANCKEEIIRILYDYCYFQFIPFSKNKLTLKVETLEKDIKFSQERWTKKACALRAIPRISNEESENAKLFFEIVKEKILQLDSIELQWKKQENLLEILEGENSNKAIQVKENIVLKNNKKVKLFL